MSDNIIDFKPRQTDTDTDPCFIRKVDRWSKGVKCCHDNAHFSYNQKRREVYCRDCKDEVDPFEAFICLGNQYDRMRDTWEKIEEFHRKAKVDSDLKKARLMELERLRPEAEQIYCTKCNNLVVQKNKKRGGGYVWLECFTCGMGWSRDNDTRVIGK